MRIPAELFARSVLITSLFVVCCAVRAPAVVLGAPVPTEPPSVPGAAQRFFQAVESRPEVSAMHHVMPFVVLRNGQPIARFQQHEDATEFLATLEYEDHSKAYELTGPGL
jgi:hypothetical protein